MINRKIGIITFLGALLLISFYGTYHYLHPFQKLKIKEWELRIKPNVSIDPSRKYQIVLWDYDWPLQKGNYRKYLHQQIAAFNLIYPNITVKLRILDLLTGPGQLADALRRGEPPDVYCSNFETPRFDYKYQVPVGPFLKPQVWRERYFPGVVRLTEIDGIQCNFPRWIRPELWLGNRRLLEDAGASVAQIQTQGWSWDDVLRLRAQLPLENHLLVGKILPETVLQAIGSQLAMTNTVSTEWELLQKIRAAKGVPIGSDLQMLERFCSGRVALLAGVKPVIWQYLQERLTHLGATWELVGLPVPAWPPGKTARTVEFGLINIYRQPRLDGYEQVAAAMKLGEYLSGCSGDGTPLSELMVIPAGRVAAVAWAKQGGVAKSILKLLGPELECNSWRLPLPNQTRLGIVDTIVQKYLSGKLSQAATVKRLQTELAAD